MITLTMTRHENGGLHNETKTRGGNLKRRKNLMFGIIMVSMLAGLAIFIASCCEDCPTCPGPGKPYKGYAYANDIINRWVYQIDTETDSMVDSVSYDSTGNYNVLSMDVSQDGRFLAVGYYHGDHRVTCIYNAQTLDLITELTPNLVPLFISDANLFIGNRSLIQRSELSFYSLPDFTLIDVDTTDVFVYLLTYVPQLDIIYAQADSNSSGPDSTFLVTYDYRQKEIVDQWFIKNDDDDWLNVFNFTIRPSDQRIYFCGSRYEGNYNACYDTEERELVYFNDDYYHAGDLELTPDGNDLYRVYPGYPEPIYIPGTIFIYNADDGSYQGGISLCGYTEYQEIPLHANAIAFTPTGDRAYVATGNLWHNDGTVLVVDTRTRQIIKLVQPELGHYHWKIVIGPKL
jgi:hypothetical protein